MMHYSLVLEEPNWHRMQEGVAMMERVPGLKLGMMEFLRHRRLLLCLSDIQSVSPGYVKSRRRRKPDGLVQKQLNSKLFFYKEQIVPSVGLNSGSSGGPCVAIERERGLKRGLDQVEGPVARKKLRED